MPVSPGVRLRHLALIVRNLDAAESLYAGKLGLIPSGRTTLDGESIRVSFVAVGESHIELLEPLDPQSALGRFLASRGEGIHHLALEIPDLPAGMTRAREAGLRLIDASPRAGAHGTLIAFIHPASTNGILVELVQRPPGHVVPDSMK